MASTEFIALLPTLLFVGAIVWQLVIVGGSTSAIEHAARDGSRVAGLGADPDAVERQVAASLPTWLTRGSVDVDRPGGTRVDVTVTVPVLFPGLRFGNWTITRSAALPPIRSEAARGTS